MERYRTDILISGGGIAGLAAAAAFGAAGFDVLCVDPAPPVTSGDDPLADLRTTAVLQPARDLLERAGLWDGLSPEATPLRVMRIVDATGPDGAPRATRDFDAADLGDAPFGWNVRNWVLRREMASRLEDLSAVDFRPGTGFVRMLVRDAAAIVTLTDGTTVQARLVVGADGRDSPVRSAAGIGARTVRYGQKALSFAVTHDRPHDDISTEIHRDGGPLVLVPLPDHDGRPCSAVVWMERGPEALRLAALDRDAFAAEATQRSAGLYGPLTVVAGPQVWPIVSRIADRMTAPRTALMAEAAHVMPPIGAQGLNTSLADLACLLDLMQAHPGDPGAPEVLSRYARAREGQVRLRAAGIDALNRASMVASPLLHDLRAAGIRALHDVAPVRRSVMRLGLGQIPATARPSDHRV